MAGGDQPEGQVPAGPCPWTGLPRRLRLADLLRTAARLGAGTGGTAVLLVDPVGMASPDGSEGPDQWGDDIARQVASCLQRVASDATARGTARAIWPGCLGDARFAVVCGGISERDAVELADRLRDRIVEAVSHAGAGGRTSPAVGVAHDPTGRGDLDTLVEAAERHLRTVDCPPGDVVPTAPDDADGPGRREPGCGTGVLGAALRPVRELLGSRLVGVQAVPFPGPVRPGADPDRDGDLRELTGRFLTEAVTGFAAWAAQGDGERWLSVPLSVAQLCDPGVMDLLDEVVAGVGLAPGTVWIEVSERVFLAEPGPGQPVPGPGVPGQGGFPDPSGNRIAPVGVGRPAGVLTRIGDRGFGITVAGFRGDFGALADLARIRTGRTWSPAARVVLDRSLVAALTGDDDTGVRLVRAVTAGLRELRVEVLADGVDQFGQVAVLLDQGVRVGRGPLLGDPVPAAELGAARALA